MANRLPVMSGRDVVAVFLKAGWSVARQSSSHIIMTKSGELATLSIPITTRSPAEHFEV